MRILMLFCCCFILHLCSTAQVVEPPATTTEQQLENITENNEDMETEDDSYLQQMQQMLRNPVNLNSATEAELKDLRVLTPIQVQQLLVYRNFFGNFINIYELQAVPSWDVETIRKLRPYVTVSTAFNLSESFGERLTDGNHTLLLRATQVLERSKGYLVDPASGNSYYPGSPQRIFFRYKYVYKNLLQYGIVGDKDAGEQFFKGKQKAGFDFYSAHIFARNIGIIKSLAIGDFTVNMGQGLTQWQSLAFKKSADIVNVKRQADVLRPYNSAGEINFHRGLGITLAKNNWQATLFGSYRRIDGNLNSDTSQTEDDFISSLQISGYHRTKSESDDKGVQRQLAFGGNFSYQRNRLHVGINGIQYSFKLPLMKGSEPYNRYALSGKSFGNYSIDYSYTFRNLHFFGEAAMTNKSATAFVNGIIMSASTLVDISMVYRNIQPAYQSLYTTAFTESTYPTNEKGLFAGVTIRPSTAWRFDAYADFYRFPWLRFRVDAPTTGSDYLVQATYRPNKQLEIYMRYRTESKPINVNPDPQLPLSPILAQPRQNWRTQASYRVSTEWTLKTRTEIVWFDKKGSQAEQGYLIYFDIGYKPIFKPLSGSIRLQYFETEGYNSRLYAFENDVLYSFSIPVFYDKGFRYYLNLNYDVNKKITVWGKFAQTIYRDKSVIGMEKL
jgi:hypothetical protein